MRAGLFLLISGVLDAVLTHLGVTFGIIEEGNPAVNLVIEKSWLLFYLIKVSLPLLLIGIIICRPLKRWVKTLIRASCAVYLTVLAIHFSWIVFYLTSIS
ncbi:MAG: DUF5658 family protein [Bacillota bacterium]|jgi:hypothetical protein|nr:DUF5658 family protein [Bacillota bacterium]MDP4155679.1 DUF5658 family protein [Bacillota bacterium]